MLFDVAKKMNRSTIFLAVLLSIGLPACKRQQIANSERVGQEALPHDDLSPNEVIKRTNALFVGVEDGSRVLNSETYLSVKALHGPAFKRELIECIEQADSITIIEHSFWTDFISPDAISLGDAYRTEKDAPKYEYRSVSLTNAQRSAFLQAANAMDGTTEEAFSLCGFEPHHRMEFIQHDKDPSKMRICFQCGQIGWDEANLMLPKGLFKVLREVVEGAGLATDRDWYRLAIERREQAAAPSGP